MADIDWNKVLKNMMLAGVAGTSVASLVGLKRLVDAQKYYDKGPTHWDDDTMYVIKKQASQGSTSGWTDGAMIAGIPLAFGGGFALTNYLFNKYLRSEAQSELDKSQVAFVNNSGYDHIKKASMTKEAERATFGMLLGNVSDELRLDKPLGWAAGAGLLGMLGSGYATYKYLQSKWPTKVPKPLTKPKKIKVVNSLDDLPGGADSARNPYAESGDDVAGLDKQSSYDGIELAARFLCNMDKEASVASEIVHACAAGRADEFEKAVDEIGFMSAVDLVKGASAVPVNPIAKEIAVTYCTKVASFADQFRLAASAEFQALHPEFSKQAAMQTGEAAELLDSFAQDFGAAVRHDFAVELGADDSLQKNASVNDDFIADSFKAVMNKLAASPIVDNSDMQSTDVSDNSTAANSTKDP